MRRKGYHFVAMKRRGPYIAYLSILTSFAIICCFPGGLDESPLGAATINTAESHGSCWLAFLLFECLCCRMGCSTRRCCCCCRPRRCFCCCWLSSSFATHASSAVQLLGELLSAPFTGVPSALQPGSVLRCTDSLSCCFGLVCTPCFVRSCEGTLPPPGTSSSLSSSASSWQSGGVGRVARLG